MSNLDSQSLPNNPDPRPNAGSGVSPISEKNAQMGQATDNVASKGSMANDSGANPMGSFNLSEQSPPYPTIPQFSSLSSTPDNSSPLTYQDLKPMIARAIGEMFREGTLSLPSMSSAPDPRMGVQLSQPVNSAPPATPATPDAPKSEAHHPPSVPAAGAPAHTAPSTTPSSSPAQAHDSSPQIANTKVGSTSESHSKPNYGLDIEHATNQVIATERGATEGSNMSKTETIQAMADDIKKSNPSVHIHEAKAMATQQYEAKEAEIAQQKHSGSGSSLYGKSPEEVEKNLQAKERLHGETGKQYEARQERLREINHIADPVARKEAMGKFISEQLGDMYLPITLRRADGQHQTLAYLLSGVNFNADSGVSGTDGGDKPYSDYYATVPPFLGYSADQQRNYTVWFGDSNDAQFQTESVYQVSVNAPQDPTSQIVLDVGSQHADGVPTIFINSSTQGDQAIFEPTKLTLKNENGNYITADTDNNEIFIGDGKGGDQVYLNSDKLYISNSGYEGSYETDQVILSDGTYTLTMNIPDADVSWQEISICDQDGNSKIMKVLGTAPI